MIIQYGIGSPQQAGKIGGHYLQTSSGTPSLRTKRNSYNHTPKLSMKFKGAFGRYARLWNTLTTTQKAAWVTYGNSAPQFAHLDNTDPLFGYWCFQSISMYRFLSNATQITAPGTFLSVSTSNITLVTATLSPLTLGGTKSNGGTNGRTFMFAQLNFGGEIDPQLRDVVYCGNTASNSNDISLIQSTLRARYGENIQARSISVYTIVYRQVGRNFGISAVSQWFFP
jgi:hypothetical protein